MFDYHTKVLHIVQGKLHEEINMIGSMKAALKIRTWLNKNNMSQEQFARHMNVSLRTVQSWVKGESLPRLENARAIELVTKGGVTLNDLVS